MLSSFVKMAEHVKMYQYNWPRGYKNKSCTTQLSMNFFLLINVKMPTVIDILIFMTRKNSILRLSEPEKCLIS